jgi:hypothetical protein
MWDSDPLTPRAAEAQKQGCDCRCSTTSAGPGVSGQDTSAALLLAAAAGTRACRQQTSDVAEAVLARAAAAINA